MFVDFFWLIVFWLKFMSLPFIWEKDAQVTNQFCLTSEMWVFEVEANQ
jgi:hypothetical protein